MTQIQRILVFKASKWLIAGIQFLGIGLVVALAQDAAPEKGSYRDPGTMEALNNSRKLKIGDQVYFRVVEDRDPASELYVTGTGDVDFPYIGKVRAAGKTPKQLAYELKPMLEREYYFTASPWFRLP